MKAQALVSEFGASRESYERRLRFLQGAVDLDPNFAEAWGALATTHGFFVFSDYDHSPARIQAAETAMAHALRLAPELPDIIRSLGLYYYGLHRDYERATTQYEKVLQLQPNNAAAINTLGLTQRRQGHWLRSLANLRKASELEPRKKPSARSCAGSFRSIRTISPCNSGWR